MSLRINWASFTTSTHPEVFWFCTRSTSVCFNHSCKNLVTIFTVCSKVVSNLFAIHWKQPFKRPNVSTTTRLLLTAIWLHQGWDCQIRVRFHEPILKEYAESPSVNVFNSSLPICFSMFIGKKFYFWHSLYTGGFLNILASWVFPVHPTNE